MPGFSLVDVGKSNSLYTDEEISVIRRARFEDERKLEEIEVSLQDLQAQRHTIQQRINNYNVAIAPHKKLPVEVMRSIFTLCANVWIKIIITPQKNISMQESIEAANKHIKTADETQFTLLRVCRAWKQVAVAIPVLWDAVHIYDLNPLSLLITDWIYSLNQGLKSLKLHTPISAFTSPHTYRLFTRYQYKYLKVFIEHYQTPLLGFIPYEALLHLQELSLFIDDKPGLEDDESMQLVQLTSHQLPCLSSLKISARNPFPAQILPCCEKLFTLNIKSLIMPLHLCMDILHRSPLLEEASFSVIPSNPNDVFPVIQEYVNANMTKFNISFAMDGPLEMFRQLKLPNLQKLTIKIYEECWTDEAYPLLNQRFNFSQLQSLKVVTDEIDAGLLLQNAPSLVSLMIFGDAVFTDQTLNGLATGRLGSKLSQLVSCADVDLAEEKVLSMVETRWKNSCQSVPDAIGDFDNTRPVPLRFVQIYRHRLKYLTEAVGRRQLKLETLGVHVGFYSLIDC